MRKLYILILCVALSVSLIAQNQKRVIAFYNLENLFDTIIDPNPNIILADEFSPTSAKRYNTEKYYKKLDNMARVISEIGIEIDPKGISIIGLAEVENRNVLEDLIKRPVLINRNYQIVHYESSDSRGIDVALLYRPDCFELIKSWSVKKDKLPGGGTTRDLLVVEGKLDGEHIYIFVNHWPSRRGGQKRSAPRRNYVAATDRIIIDSIFKVNPDAKLVYMGDLNDDPVNKSLTVHLRAKGDMKKLKEGDLFNPFYEKYKKGNGTLAYNDAWNLFDQIIISQGLLKATEGYKYENSYIFKKKYMFQQGGRFEGYPLRTYVGDEFMNGFSDHFPTYIIISKTK